MTIKKDECGHKIFFTKEIQRLGDVCIKIQEQVVSLALDVEHIKTTSKVYATLAGILGAAVLNGLILFLLKLFYTISMEGK